MKLQLERRILIALRRGFSAQPSWLSSPAHPLTGTLYPTHPFLKAGFHSRVPQTPETKRPHEGKEEIRLQNGGSYQILAVVALSLTGAWFYLWTANQDCDLEEDLSSSSIIQMAAQIPAGRPGNLTPEQEEKLRQLWLSVFQLCGVAENTDPSSTEASTQESAVAADNESHKKKRFGLFRKHRGDSKSSQAADHSPKEAAEDDKYGQTKQFHETLAKHSPETIRETIWTMVKHDHPDALALRFLRARKWDVEKALVMMVSTMNWRHSEMHVDDDIMKHGEAGAVADASSEDGNIKRMGDDFLAQIRMGKSFLHGTDKNGRPICVVRVRLHKQGEQCEESLERYTVYLIETTRMVLSPPVDTATIVFDMTGFSMANMDYTPVKFMIKCFEANYPESLGAVLVHNSPWLFQGLSCRLSYVETDLLTMTRYLEGYPRLVRPGCCW